MIGTGAWVSNCGDCSEAGHDRCWLAGERVVGLRKVACVNGRDVKVKNQKKKYKSHDRIIGKSRSVAGLPTSLKLAVKTPRRWDNCSFPGPLSTRRAHGNDDMLGVSPTHSRTAQMHIPGTGALHHDHLVPVPLSWIPRIPPIES